METELEAMEAVFEADAQKLVLSRRHRLRADRHRLTRA